MNLKAKREPKVEISDAHDLKARDRAILKWLCEHAGQAKHVLDPKGGLEMPLSAIPLRNSKDRDLGRLRDSLDRLIAVKVTG